MEAVSTSLYEHPAAGAADERLLDADANGAEQAAIAVLRTWPRRSDRIQPPRRQGEFNRFAADAKVMFLERPKCRLLALRGRPMVRLRVFACQFGLSLPHHRPPTRAPSIRSNLPEEMDRSASEDS